MNNNFFTSESVGKGHPDKICDQISDAVLDACLTQDSNAFVACEVFASNRLIVIGGEISTREAYVDVVNTAWNVLKPLGYTENDFTIISNINKQSPDINQAVTRDNTIIGAGDQGIVFGYANRETKDYFPLGITLAHELLKRLENERSTHSWMKADMKSQVTIDYSVPNKPRIAIMLASVQHSPETSLDTIKDTVGRIMLDLAKDYGLNNDFEQIINSSGSFTIGGPIGDTGLTGRKIIVDTYGGMARHGGGAFSGKDPSKVDRSGAYIARYIAKNIVASGIADKCEIQLSFAIGLPKPLSVHVDTFGTGKFSEQTIEEMVTTVFNLSVDQFIKKLNLYKIKYQPLSVYGHFGANAAKYAWEQLDKVEEIQDFFNERAK